MEQYLSRNLFMFANYNNILNHHEIINKKINLNEPCCKYTMNL